MSKIDISIIIASYNEGPTFEKSVEKIVKVLKTMKRKWEIVFVEDKSLDETKNKIEKLTKRIKNSKVIIHSKNMGRGRSVTDGIKKSQGSICGYLDVDLEISANYIPVFVKEIENGFDMAAGKRFYENNFRAILRFLASKMYAYLVKMIINLPIEDTEAGYKFFKRDKMIPILSKVKDERWFWDTEICARAYWAGLRISQIPVLFVRRKDKKSTVKLFSDTCSYIFKLIDFKSQVPQRVSR